MFRTIRRYLIMLSLVSKSLQVSFHRYPHSWDCTSPLVEQKDRVWGTQYRSCMCEAVALAVDLFPIVVLFCLYRSWSSTLIRFGNHEIQLFINILHVCLQNSSIRTSRRGKNINWSLASFLACDCLMKVWSPQQTKCSRDTQFIPEVHSTAGATEAQDQTLRRVPKSHGEASLSARKASSVPHTDAKWGRLRLRVSHWDAGKQYQGPWDSNLFFDTSPRDSSSETK